MIELLRPQSAGVGPQGAKSSGFPANVLVTLYSGAACDIYGMDRSRSARFVRAKATGARKRASWHSLSYRPATASGVWGKAVSGYFSFSGCKRVGGRGLRTEG